MFLCAITDTLQLPGSNQDRHANLIQLARHWALSGIDYIQLREKHLAASELAQLASDLIATLRTTGSSTRCILNGPPTIAIAAKADGVHIPSGPGQHSPAEIRSLYRAASLPPPTISLSCHSVDDILHARGQQATFALFAPVFEKPLPGKPFLPGQGIEALRAAASAAAPMPVLALGGITRQNASQCLAAGAAGIASIRLFLPDANGNPPDLTRLRELRTLKSEQSG